MLTKIKRRRRPAPNESARASSARGQRGTPAALSSASSALAMRRADQIGGRLRERRIERGGDGGGVCSARGALALDS